MDELTIKRYCDMQGYNYRYFGNDVIIITDLDEWELKYKNDKILVKHYNKANNRAGKMQFHKQRYAYDLDYIFNSIIIPHGNYNKKFQKVFEIKKVLQNCI